MVGWGLYFSLVEPLRFRVKSLSLAYKGTQNPKPSLMDPLKEPLRGGVRVPSRSPFMDPVKTSLVGP